MAAVPPRLERRRPRPGSLERPVNARLYRGTWLLVGLPLLLLAFTVGHPGALAKPTLPPGFDRASAVDLARDLARTNPDRSPGTTGSIGWLRRQLRPYGLRPHVEAFDASIPGRGRVLPPLPLRRRRRRRRQPRLDRGRRAAAARDRRRYASLPRGDARRDGRL